MIKIVSRFIDFSLFQSANASVAERYRFSPLSLSGVPYALVNLASTLGMAALARNHASRLDCLPVGAAIFAVARCQTTASRVCTTTFVLIGHDKPFLAGGDVLPSYCDLIQHLLHIGDA